MARSKKKNFYAVKRGRVPGIYSTWDECAAQVNGFSGAAYQGFFTRAEAEAYMTGSGAPGLQELSDDDGLSQSLEQLLSGISFPARTSDAEDANTPRQTDQTTLAADDEDTPPWDDEVPAPLSGRGAGFAPPPASSPAFTASTSSSRGNTSRHQQLMSLTEKELLVQIVLLLEQVVAEDQSTS